MQPTEPFAIDAELVDALMPLDDIAFAIVLRPFGGWMRYRRDGDHVHTVVPLSFRRARITRGPDDLFVEEFW